MILSHFGDARYVIKERKFYDVENIFSDPDSGDDYGSGFC